MLVDTGYACRGCENNLHDDQFDAADACECFPKRSDVRLVHRCGQCRKRYPANQQAQAQICCTGLMLTWDRSLIQAVPVAA